MEREGKERFRVRFQARRRDGVSGIGLVVLEDVWRWRLSIVLLGLDHGLLYISAVRGLSSKDNPSKHKPVAIYQPHVLPHGYFQHVPIANQVSFEG